MAQKVNIILVDDLDGGDADESVSFGLDGTSYEIDLSAANAAKMREALALYVGHARKTGGAGRRRRGAGGRSSAGASGGTSAAEIRDWGRAKGWSVSERGRVAADLRAAYEAAH